MKLEDQVCSLVLAKRLKELNVPQDSLWCHTQFQNRDCGVDKYGGIKDQASGRWYAGARDLKIASAFTVAELGEMLPNSVCGGEYGVTYRLEFGKNPDSYSALYVSCSGCYPLLNYLKAETEVGARAKMLIYLIEKKWVNPSELK